MSPSMSRLAPLMVSPEANSMVAVVSAPPGRKRISGGMTTRRGFSRVMWFPRVNTMTATTNDATIGAMA